MNSKIQNSIRIRFSRTLFSILAITCMAFQTAFTMPAQMNRKALGATAAFADVPTDYWAFQYIEALYSAGITGGCNTSPLSYCPEDPVTRAQMAIFILRGMHGSAYAPVDATGTIFTDVPLSAFAVNWIEQFSFEGITAGCASDSYCPNANITRAQMAIFLLRGIHGNDYVPPTATGTVFSDVPFGYWADKWVEQLAAEGITGGCGNGMFCPDAYVTRAQMAVFLVKTFNLPLDVLSPIVPDTTKILSDTSTQYLSSISNDGSVYTFSQGTQELDGLAPGDMMVGEANSTDPYGFLRKVVSVSNNGGQVIVETQPAAIEDAIQQGEISISSALVPSSTKQANFTEGVQPMTNPAATNKIFLQLNNVVLYDDDGNTNTTNDQINANGSVSLEPVLNFSLKVQDFQLKELYFTLTANQTAQLKIGSKLYVTAKAEKTLATYPMGPLFLTIGAFPVTIYPVLTIVAGIDGTISASVSTGVTQKLTETAGLSYANNNWSPIQQFSNKFTYDAPALSSGLSIKGYTGAKLKILLYGSVGPDISLNAYLKLEANPLQTPWWKLYGGLEMPVGISVEIFSHVIAGYSAVVIDYQILLAQASNCGPGQIINDSVNDVSPSYIDVTSLSTTLIGETLLATIHIRDVPDQLTFNRIGVPSSHLEYEWGVYVDLDNNSQTGSTSNIQGAEYSLSAMHFVFMPNSPTSLPISDGVQKNVWQFDPSDNSWWSIATASLTVDPLSDTITLSGTIPGITVSSRLAFYTLDYNPGGSRLSDQSSCLMKASSFSYNPIVFTNQTTNLAEIQNWKLLTDQ